MSTAPPATAQRRAAPPVITAWSAVSPYGLGRAAHAAGLASGGPTAGPVDDTQPLWAGGPDESACLVPGFEVRKVLGKAGTRTMDRVTGLAVTAVRELFQDAADAADGADGAGTGTAPVPAGAGTALVLGTTLGSAYLQHMFSKASFEGTKPYDVPTQWMPNVLMNCPASATAIRYGLKGPNATLAGGRPAALLALAYARRLLAAGRAERTVVGASEEYSAARAWLERHGSAAAGGAQDVPLGEGCAVLVLEPGDGGADAGGSGNPPLAEVLAIDVRTDIRGDVPATLADCVTDALDQAASRPDDVWAALGGGLPGPAGDAEQALLSERFGAAATERLAGHELIGDTAAASGAFQLAAVLAGAAADPAAAGRTAVVTSVDRDGVVACAVLRLCEQAPRRGAGPVPMAAPPRGAPGHGEAAQLPLPPGGREEGSPDE
ncbi:beta-ketoacyl synthase N-terminal-like domain-containing protein [Streptomyces boncukensis]|uniref:3-oxoacyl-ACP synthase n=1 Tax=Streptomyces boncukensis TaxID=2711219 RepID=A0A6G4X4T8_9ACTN|nr:beta-ketoacyl synthase N-terminal-like domain-containing protein [Streptomyces boncukensis]NGO71890.1 3-oxoacyl-ACP synthase [Streptomyces boncukensis]